MKRDLLHILQHSLGLDQYGQGDSYRNYFCTGPGCSSFEHCCELVTEGLMSDRGAQEIAGGMHYFHVTDAGKEAVRLNSPEPPKLTRSQKRYRRYLASGATSFRDYLRRETHASQYAHT